jgi:hypothetical protein
MGSVRTWLLAGVALLGLATTAAQADDSDQRNDGWHGMKIQAHHVLLISIDGMHQVDLQRWIQNNPHGGLAELAKRGTTYSQAYTTLPSDSFPGMIAQLTGGKPYSAGVFYDDSYDRTFYPPGSNCAGTPGAETTFAENLDYNLNDVTGGGTLGDAMSQIDPAHLPMTFITGTCTVVYPHQFIRVNTIFEVLRAHGMHTAWSDKHPAYEILNGPSGKGIEDLYTPEINSQVPGAPSGNDYTTSYKDVRTNDSMKVTAVINEIEAKRSVGSFVGYTPAIFGMNFQAVSVGQKLASSGWDDPAGLVGGYADAAGTPGNALTAQLQFVDESIGKMVSALKDYNLYHDTVVIISAKHGQSPIDRSLRRAIPDSYSTVLANAGYGFNIADDASLIWLDPSQRTPETLQSALTVLQNAAGALGIQTILGRDQLRKVFRDPITDSRTPDFFVVSNKGVIYTKGSKLAEHGGAADDDRHVALLVSAPGLEEGQQVDKQVSTTQIAPTILGVLGISPEELQAVRIEHTHTLPGLPD